MKSSSLCCNDDNNICQSIIRQDIFRASFLRTGVPRGAATQDFLSKASARSDINLFLPILALLAKMRSGIYALEKFMR